MKLGQFSNGGAIILAIVLFAVAAGRLIVQRAPEALDPNVKVIRFAHWQLEPGVREAFDRIAADYEALHPGVRVEQVAVPGRVWRQWVNTRLVGADAPDLVETASYILSDEVLARHFVPLTEVLNRPNPYNADEPDLRDLPWRLTFTAELVPVEGVHYYSYNLLEYYGVPSAMVTVRVFYNRALLVEILGEDRPPRTFDEFVDVCRRIQEFSAASGRAIHPMAGSVFNVTKLTDKLFRNVSQRLALALNERLDLMPSTTDGLIGYLKGGWSLDHPEVRNSLRTVEALGHYMQGGWVQLDREDATLQFTQQHAVMIATGTWDAMGLIQQSPFDVGAFPIPHLQPDDPVYGAGVLGDETEGNTYAAMPFGLTQYSRHPDIAIDFLQFLTNRRNNRVFSEYTAWLPVIKGVEVPPIARPFAPVTEGFVPGFNLRAMSTSTHDTLVRHLHLLTGRQASVERYVEQTRRAYDESIVPEIERQSRIRQESIRRGDTGVAAMTWLAQRDRDRASRDKGSLLAARQNDVEAVRAQMLFVVREGWPPPE